MNIVILGAGTVGSWLAKLLCEHPSHVITLVDSDPDHIQRINEELDAKTITGNAAEASVLFQAGVMISDLCLALTGDDEVNMIAASIARAMGSRRSIARVYAPIFHDLSTFDYQRHFGIDRFVSPEHLSAVELAQRIRHPGSLVVENFAHGDIQVQEITVTSKSKMLGMPIRQLGLPKGVIIGSIEREGGVFIAEAEDELKEGDRIILIGSHENIEAVSYRFEKSTPKKKGVVIAGGGETGFHLARLLKEDHYTVVLMEADYEQCNQLAARLPHVTVVHSDATIQKNLEEERIGSADVFIACTGDDENNIVACVEAKELGAASVMAIVSRPDYANILGKLGIDHAVSPREVVAKQVMSFLNAGPLIYRRALGSEEAADGEGVTVMEIEVLEDVPATQHVLANLDLPPSCLIASVSRGEITRVPGADDRLEPGDTVIAMAANKAVRDTLKLFYPNGVPAS